MDPAILLPAVGQAFVKLDPRQMIRSPVMFVVGRCGLDHCAADP
jgi:K+-transporting ATPase ATPase B chain